MVREAAQAVGKTQYELASEVGIGYPTLKKWLGKTVLKETLPEPRAVIRIALALGIDPLEMLAILEFIPPAASNYEQAFLRLTQRRLSSNIAAFNQQRLEIKERIRQALELQNFLNQALEANIQVISDLQELLTGYDQLLT